MAIIFDSKLLKIKSPKIIKIPVNLSKSFSSRSIVRIKGTINDGNFKIPLEPDGKDSHWIELNSLLSEQIGANIGDTVSLSIEQTN